MGVVLATDTAGANRAEWTAAARAEREGLRGHAGGRVARGENGGGCGARESLHWLVGAGERKRGREKERRGGAKKRRAWSRETVCERESSARRLEDVGRGKGVGFWLADFWRACRGRKGDVLTCHICERWIRWVGPCSSFYNILPLQIFTCGKCKNIKFLPPHGQREHRAQLILN